MNSTTISLPVEPSEKASQQIETGINLGDAHSCEKQHRDKYGELAKQLDKYNDTLLNMPKMQVFFLVSSMMPSKRITCMYAPFQRVMEAEKRGTASGAAKLQAGKPTKRMKGSTRDIVAPIESVLKNTYAIISQCGEEPGRPNPG